jgi:hypothetical protein
MLALPYRRYLQVRLFEGRTLCLPNIKMPNANEYNVVYQHAPDISMRRVFFLALQQKSKYLNHHILKI